jgi:hypothetical protein
VERNDQGRRLVWFDFGRDVHAIRQVLVGVCEVIAAALGSRIYAEAAAGLGEAGIGCQAESQQRGESAC